MSENTELPHYHSSIYNKSVNYYLLFSLDTKIFSLFSFVYKANKGVLERDMYLLLMTAIFIKGVNKKRRPEYLFLNSVPYTCDIEFSESRVFENKIKDNNNS